MLLIGPPGSGKTTLVLSRLKAALREHCAAETLLIVPTVSMAQHLLHQLARDHGAVPSRLVRPLADVVRSLTPELEEAPPAIDAWLLRAAVEQSGAEIFRPLLASPGLYRRLSRTIRELQAAGCRPETLAALAETRAQRSLAPVFRLYQRFLAVHGFVSPAERLTAAAQKAALDGLDGVRWIFFDGFFFLSQGEAELMDSLRASGAEATVTLPSEPRARLLHQFERQRLRDLRRPRVEPVVWAAPGIEQELEEVARGILEAQRPFRDFGVILRQPADYSGALQAVFERFGIPFRSIGSQPLQRHPASLLIRELLQAIADGFPGEEALAALRRPYSRASADPAFDAYDFRVREALPQSGLDFLQRDAPSGVSAYLDELAAQAHWRDDKAAPATWAQRCRDFRDRHVRFPATPDGLPPRRVLELRSLGKALEGIERCAVDAARLLTLQGRSSVSLGQFLEAYDQALAFAVIDSPDRRRDVVNVLSIYEARQWEAPVVFVCGLVEGRFPYHEPEDLFLTDEDRLSLGRYGVGLRTRGDLADEEKFLFDIASSRATEKLVLSYPQTDASGAALLRSFFLPPDPRQDRPAAGAKPLEAPPVFRRPPDFLESEEERRIIAERHAAFSPSSLDNYLQCPYLFFGRRTLRLEGPPKPAERRLDNLFKGIVIHQTIAEWSRDRSQPIGQVLSRIFDQRLQDGCIPPSFRTEMTKAMLEGDLERYARGPSSQPIADSLHGGHESEIQFAVEDFAVQGRIDRFDVVDSRSAVVIDYKYSAPQRVKALYKDYEAGRALQAFLYLTGVEREQGLAPAGALLFGLRKETAVAGWMRSDLHDRSSFLGRQVRSLSVEELQQLLETAERASLRAARAIRAGSVEVAPQDRDFCAKFCDFRDVCRVEL